MLKGEGLAGGRFGKGKVWQGEGLAEGRFGKGKVWQGKV